MKLSWLAPTLLVLLAACGGTETVDARYRTPEATVETMLTAYGVQDVSQEAIRDEIAVRGAFTLQDPESYRGAFVDIDQPGGEGMAGYVFGMIAAAKDELRFESAGEGATIYVREDIHVAMRRGDDQAYRIVLRESVPESVQRSMVQIEENASHR